MFTSNKTRHAVTSQQQTQQFELLPYRSAMSGTAFLEEIVSWDDEKRAEKVEEALPRLIVSFSAEDWAH